MEDATIRLEGDKWTTPEPVELSREQFLGMWQHYKEVERKKGIEAQKEMFSKLERQDEKLS